MLAGREAGAVTQMGAGRLSLISDLTHLHSGLVISQKLQGCIIFVKTEKFKQFSSTFLFKFLLICSLNSNYIYRLCLGH